MYYVGLIGLSYLQLRVHKSQHWMCHLLSQITQTIKTTSSRGLVKFTSRFCYAQEMWLILQNVPYNVRYSGREHIRHTLVCCATWKRQNNEKSLLGMGEKGQIMLSDFTTLDSHSHTCTAVLRVRRNYPARVTAWCMCSQLCSCWPAKCRSKERAYSISADVLM